MQILARPPLRTESARNPVEYVEILDEGVVAMRDHIAPSRAVRFRPIGARIRRKFRARQLVLTMNASPRCSDLVFMIAFVRQKDLEFKLRISRPRA